MQYAFHEILDLDVFFFRTCKLETFVTYEWQECDDFWERMKRIRITPILQNSAMIVRLLLTNYVRVHTLSMYAASGEGVYHAK